LQKLHQTWYVQSTCATSGDGLYEGLDWLSNAIREKRSVKKNESPKTDEVEQKKSGGLWGLFKSTSSPNQA
jgi:hypothetical protein